MNRFRMKCHISAAKFLFILIVQCFEINSKNKIQTNLAIPFKKKNDEKQNFLVMK